MYRYLFRRGGRRRWPRSRAGGCLLWLLIFVLVLIVLSILFGGFDRGTKVGGLPPMIITAAGRSSSGMS